MGGGLEGDRGGCVFHCQRESELGLACIGQTIRPRVYSHGIEGAAASRGVDEAEAEALLSNYLSHIFSECEVSVATIVRIGQLLAWVSYLSPRDSLGDINDWVEIFGESPNLQGRPDLLA